MNINDGAKQYLHDLIDDAYTRQEIVDKMIIKGHSKAFAEEALIQVMNEIVKKVSK